MKRRHRRCDNPYPQNGGVMCPGKSYVEEEEVEDKEVSGTYICKIKVSFGLCLRLKLTQTTTTTSTYMFLGFVVLANQRNTQICFLFRGSLRSHGKLVLVIQPGPNLQHSSARSQLWPRLLMHSNIFVSFSVSVLCR